MQENSKIIVYTPFFREFIKCILQLIIKFPVHNQPQKQINTTIKAEAILLDQSINHHSDSADIEFKENNTPKEKTTTQHTHREKQMAGEKEKNKKKKRVLQNSTE